MNSGASERAFQKKLFNILIKRIQKTYSPFQSCPKVLVPRYQEEHSHKTLERNKNFDFIEKPQKTNFLSNIKVLVSSFFTCFALHVDCRAREH